MEHRATAYAAVILAVFCCVSTLSAAERTLKQRAEVHLSDGTVLKGLVQLTPRSNFYFWIISDDDKKLTGGRKKVREFNFDVIREMSFTRLSRHRKCTVTFGSGEKLSGILKSVVIYLHVQKPGDVMPTSIKKYALRSQMREKQVVKRVRMIGKGREYLAKTPLVLNNARLGPLDELFAITAKTLSPVTVTPTDRPGHYEVNSTLGEDVFIAARIGDTYVAGWPAQGAKRNDLFKEVEIHITKIAEYYNERKLLGIIVNDTGTLVQSLISLRRQVSENASDASGGQFDKEGAIEHFRLSVWKWRRNPENGEMALFKRGSFCRVRVSPHAETPPAKTAAGLWPVVNEGKRFVVGTAEEKKKEQRIERRH